MLHHLFINSSSAAQITVRDCIIILVEDHGRGMESLHITRAQAHNTHTKHTRNTTGTFHTTWHSTRSPCSDIIAQTSDIMINIKSPIERLIWQWASTLIHTFNHSTNIIWYGPACYPQMLSPSHLTCTMPHSQKFAGYGIIIAIWSSTTSLSSQHQRETNASTTKSINGRHQHSIAVRIELIKYQLNLNKQTSWN